MGLNISIVVDQEIEADCPYWSSVALSATPSGQEKANPIGKPSIGLNY